MISTIGCPPATLRGDRGLDERAHLHAVELGLEDAEPHAARAEHRVGLPPVLAPRASSVRPASSSSPLRVAHEQLLDVGEELVQRRVEQAHGDGQAVHRLEDPDRSRRAGARRARASAACSSSASAARMNRCTRGSRSPRNMCSVRQRPMPSAPKSRATCASCGRSALVRTLSVRNSSAQPRMIAERARSGSGVITGTAPTTTSPVVPLIEMTSPSRTTVSPTRNSPLLDADVERRRAAHRGRAHAARDDRRVAHETAA